MKKSKKIMLRMIPVLFACLTILTVFSNGIFAVETTLPEGGDEPIEGVTGLAYRVWNTVTVVAQVIAFIAIIFAGIRYMFASADAKADIKKQTIILVVGAILVFGASIVVQVIMGIVDEVGQDFEARLLTNFVNIIG